MSILSFDLPTPSWLLGDSVVVPTMGQQAVRERALKSGTGAYAFATGSTPGIPGRQLI